MSRRGCRGRTEEEALPELEEFDEGEVCSGAEELDEGVGGFVAELFVWGLLVGYEYMNVGSGTMRTA